MAYRSDEIIDLTKDLPPQIGIVVQSSLMRIHEQVITRMSEQVIREPVAEALIGKLVDVAQAFHDETNIATIPEAGRANDVLVTCIHPGGHPTNSRTITADILHATMYSDQTFYLFQFTLNLKNEDEPGDYTGEGDYKDLIPEIEIDWNSNVTISETSTSGTGILETNLDGSQTYDQGPPASLLIEDEGFFLRKTVWFIVAWVNSDPPPGSCGFGCNIEVRWRRNGSIFKKAKWSWDEDYCPYCDVCVNCNYIAPEAVDPDPLQNVIGWLIVASDVHHTNDNVHMFIVAQAMQDGLMSYGQVTGSVGSNPKISSHQPVPQGPYKKGTMIEININAKAPDPENCDTWFVSAEIGDINNPTRWLGYSFTAEDCP